MLAGKTYKYDRNTFVGASYALAALLFLGCHAEGLPLANGQLSVHVSTGVPSAYATVEVLQLDQAGAVRTFVTQGITDADGWVILDIGTARHNLLVTANGGETQELWSDERFTAKVEMRTALVGFAAGTHAPVAVTPYTTIATALGERRYAMDQSEGYSDAMLHAYELISEHLMGLDIAGTIPSDMRSAMEIYTGSEQYGLALAGLHGLSAAISGRLLAASAFNSQDVLKALEADISSPEALFDGADNDGPIAFPSCFASIHCTVDLAEECLSICNLSASTLRRDLAAGLLFDFLLTDDNATGMGAANASPLIEHMRQNDEPELFGSAPIESFSYHPPIIQVDITRVIDERNYTVHFMDAHSAIPSFRVQSDSSAAEVELGRHSCEGDDIPHVSKYVTELNSKASNPLVWRFHVFGDSGAFIDPHSGKYRVGIRRDSSSPEEVEWLTHNDKDDSAWLPATLLGQGANNSYRYEVVLIRDLIPELATQEGRYVIEFAGIDGYGQRARETRCWKHTILPPPLYVSGPQPLGGEGFPVSLLFPSAIEDLSLHSSFNDLSKYLNGVSVPEGVGLFWFEIRNGTNYPVLASIYPSYEDISFRSTWHVTNEPADPPSKLPQTCDEPWCFTGSIWPELMGSWTTDSTTSAHTLISGVRVWDVTDPIPREILPCSKPVEKGNKTGDITNKDTCSNGEVRLEPRVSEYMPRRYIAIVVASQLPFFVQPGTRFEEFALFNGEEVTGVKLGSVMQCVDNAVPPCGGQVNHYLRYMALESAELAGSVAMVGFTRSTGAASRQPFDLRVEDEAEEVLVYPLSWSIHGEIFPAPIPPMSPTDTGGIAQ